VDEKILFVDDEDSILQAFRRILHKRFIMDFANSGRAALAKMASDGPFAVIVADMKMPEMEGVELLSKVHDLYPDTVRIMLTGIRDIDVAVDAVNQGNIFRFLNKPTDPDMLANVLNAALTQYRLLTAERELLEKTLHGSVEVLTELIALVSPTIGHRTNRIRQYMMYVVSSLKLPDQWQYELAAMLSQIGTIAIPSEILEKSLLGETLSESESQILDNHPTLARKLLAKIPRLTTVSAMIGAQNKPFSAYPESISSSAVGAQILKACGDFDRYMQTDISRDAAIYQMKKQTGMYNPRILEALSEVSILKPEKVLAKLGIMELKPFMVINKDVRARNGITVIPAGQEINVTILEILRSFSSGIGVIEPIEVLTDK
jgi:response regulator RpfG family c-di-GMP phosphodiesterase